eukprot:m.160878 g.160878  ORF g.160878 m.160878 type:complete len:297 (+) comp31204_c0_seq3:112-1002(+)
MSALAAAASRNTVRIVAVVTARAPRILPTAEPRAAVPSNAYIPEPAQWLINSNVNVPASLMFTTLDWDYVLRPGVLSAEIQREAERDYKNICMYKEQKCNLKPEHAKKIFKRFSVWLHLVIPQNVLNSISLGGKEMETAIRQLTDENSVLVLEERMDNVLQTLKDGNIEQARHLAQRIEAKAEHFNALIDSYRKDYETEQAQNWDLIWLNYKAAGIMSTIGFGRYWDTTKSLSMAASHVKDGVIRWLNSPRCPEYLAKAQKVRTHQLGMIMRMNEAVDKLEFELLNRQLMNKSLPA